MIFANAQMHIRKTRAAGARNYPTTGWRNRLERNNDAEAII
jgi:hypothetical protein